MGCSFNLFDSKGVFWHNRIWLLGMGDLQTKRRGD